MADTQVKICGITNVEDALYAVEAGADALGFVFYAKSPRCVTPVQVLKIIAELPPFVTTVGLFVNEDIPQVRRIMTAARLDVVQLHGDEPPEDCIIEPLRVIKGLRVKDAASLEGADRYQVSALLLDAWSDKGYGGTGEQFDWQLVKKLTANRPVILAGGLNPDNVATAVQQVQPYAVDVSSGVEERPGKKDHQKVAEFIRQVRNA
ncbi:phosphoribosylanthranilate isomerase [Malonomonas rubra DSM 5091]|uniref:N-(5'-phosphoribosyl)anthranilate isomerase n=1 Tax=Malonomonas rubra DSM 5091 TaxID=1122189 RepID=A0A1M6F2E6_MALRU|nr:phosphoribosylanthranilate isomerase [Malonomonas rubra]SHI91841.1 phosphoribosylanthranilate isomerase [Malonomonas rubra DSM 5091]